MIFACYFPPEFQGEYKMQSTNSNGAVQYSDVNITATAIPIWGNCYRKVGNNYILMINSGGNSCIRCLHLQLSSKTILQVHGSSKETISKCYINEDSAVANCPSEELLQTRSTAEIILFKTKDMDGNDIPKEYCPLIGKFSVKYRLNDRNRRECRGIESHLHSCPAGSSLNIHFQDCTFDSYDLKFDCLGHWENPSGHKYLALLDNRQLRNHNPQYRCAIYKQNLTTGVIHMAVGKDSTCSSDLHNATHGYEIFLLMPREETSWPPEVLYTQCIFPDWMIGSWEHVIVQDNTFIYQDHSTFKTHTIKCVGKLDADDKYLVFSRTQCDEEQYNCMRIQKRGNNIMEFQMGTNFSTNKDVFELCSDLNFQKDSWITQGRLDRKIESSCPIAGEFTGVIPNTTELCAKLWSDCRAPELMYYQLADCVTSDIYEERQYRCLGHWRESKLLYTYTQRKDVAADTFECFVGSIVSENEDFFIKEAGEHCQRGMDPLQYGMKLTKQGLYSCIGQPHIVSTQRNDITTKRFTTELSTISTKPWNIGVPYPTIPDVDNNISKANSMQICITTVIIFLLVISIFK